MIANVSRFLDRIAADQPDGCALRVPRGRNARGSIEYLDLSFAELAEQQDAWAAKLRAAGIGQDSLVLLMARPGLPLIALCFALFKIGAAPMVIDPGMGLGAFLKCVRQAKPTALVGIPLAIFVSRLFRGSFASVKTRVAVGGPQAMLPKPAAAEAPAPTQAEDLAAILFTSGSTGPPKGVCYEHGMFEAQVEAVRDCFSIEPGEVDLPMLPIFALFNPALGMTTVVPEMNPSRPAAVDPSKIVTAIKQCEVTNSFGSPVLWGKIAAYCRSRGETLPSLKRILMAGAPMPLSLASEYRSILGSGHVYSPYGATEVLPVSAIKDEEILSLAAESDYIGKGTCVGGLLPGVEARILAPSDEVLQSSALGKPLPDGEIGEIVVTGPTVTKSYYRLPEATSGSKIEEGGRVWHRMGDLGYFDTEGRLWFCGRKAERVEANDKVYDTDRCESVFNQHQRVYRAALIRSERNGVAAPAIVIEPVSGRFPQSRREKAAFAQDLRKLGQANAVSRDIDVFFFCRSFPVDARHNAKIHRLSLAKQYSDS